MSRLIHGTTLLFCVLLALAVPAAYAQPAGPPVDQASWAARKRIVALPNGVRLAYVELGNPAGRPLRQTATSSRAVRARFMPAP
jgi:hypothetical protein